MKCGLYGSVSLDQSRKQASNMAEASSHGAQPAKQVEEEEEEEKEKSKVQGQGSPTAAATHHKSLPDAASAATPAAHGDEKGIQQSTTVFVFWAYVVTLVSLLTLSMVLFTSIMPSDEETEFFAMPPDVRHHSTKGKLLKIDLGEDRRPLKVFVREEGPVANSECAVLLHGLGASSFTYRHVISNLASRGLRVVALDFPGAGLSEKPVAHRWSFLIRLREVWQEISEKGLFWRFEQLFETGALPDPEPSSSEKDLHYNAADLAECLSQVVSLLVSSPVHIVLHDTSVEAGLTWAIRNPFLVRSITFIDASSGSPSFPAGLLGLPGFGSMVLWSSFLHHMLLQLCCVKSLTQAEAEFHAFLLRNKNGRMATLHTWKTANASFDVVSSIEDLGQVPLQVMWSNSSGKSWQELGERLVSRLHGASYVSHNGGRWPQEDAASEIAEGIYRFISSMPQTVHSFSDELVPQHIQEMFDRMSTEGDSIGNSGHHGHNCHTHNHGHGDHNHDHGHMHDSHDHGDIHDHGLGYMDNMGHGGWVL